MKKQIVYRSAITGRFITARKAASCPKTTVKETIKIKSKKKKK